MLGFHFLGKIKVVLGSNWTKRFNWCEGSIGSRIQLIQGFN